ncbi:MAG: hypothetical protein ABI427_14840 [Solirubrobacteraceae bacterium]
MVLSMTRHATWEGETERLTGRFLTRLLGEPSRCDYYVVGTPAMAGAAVAALRDAGVQRNQIFDEAFSGYDKPLPLPLAPAPGTLKHA